MVRILPVLMLGLIAACAAPDPRCTSPATRELKTIDRLIAETEATLARGYATARPNSSQVNLCLGGRQTHVGVSFCTDLAGGRRAVAIDTASEQRKLDALRARHAELTARIAADSAACAAPQT